MGELKPCPRCGADLPWIVPPYKPRRPERVYVECWFCHFHIKPRFGRKRAIKAWNRLERYYDLSKV